MDNMGHKGRMEQQSINKKMWEQQPGEPAVAYRWFLYFLEKAMANQSLANQDPEYFYLEAYKRSTSCQNATAISKGFRAWIDKYDWFDRYKARAEDLIMQKAELAARSESVVFQDELEKFRKTTTEIADLGMQLSGAILYQISTWLNNGNRINSPKDVELFLRVAINLQESSRASWSEALSVPALNELIATKDSNE